jgi:hypothetical protein
MSNKSEIPRKEIFVLIFGAIWLMILLAIAVLYRPDQWELYPKLVFLDLVFALLSLAILLLGYGYRIAGRVGLKSEEYSQYPRGNHQPKV